MDQEKEAILYVDDELANLDGFRYALRKEYRILTAISAKEGLEILKSNSVKVVISDQRMPEITGIEFLKQVLDLYPDIIRIVLTGYTDIEATIHAINEGKVFHYITKPWKKEEIRIVIDNALQHYNLKKENDSLIQHLKQKNIELDEARKEAELSEKLKSSFLSNISHEIRTPLNGIVGFSNLLMNRFRDNTDVARMFELITNSSNDLLRIVHDLVDISQLESGDLTMKYTNIEAKKFLEETYKIYLEHDALKKKKIELNIDVHIDDKIQIKSDIVRLRQILANLLNNALKFTNEGFVELGAYKQDNTLIYYVQDSGIGIPEQDKKNIFEPFYKVDYNQNLHRGNGLGLSISKKIAELLNCYLKVESVEDKGSTFSLHIPLLSNP
jgi:two-component system sensor histidine kinase/response regulator